MKAVWDDKVIAEADEDDLIYIEGNWYFPPDSLNQQYFRESDTPYNCPWKGDTQYFDVGEGEDWSADNAWSYPDPVPSSIEKVKKDYSDYVAFWRSVQVIE